VCIVSCSIVVVCVAMSSSVGLRVSAQRVPAAFSSLSEAIERLASLAQTDESREQLKAALVADAPRIRTLTHNQCKRVFQFLQHPIPNADHVGGGAKTAFYQDSLAELLGVQLPAAVPGENKEEEEEDGGDGGEEEEKEVLTQTQPVNDALSSQLLAAGVTLDDLVQRVACAVRGQLPSFSLVPDAANTSAQVATPAQALLSLPGLSAPNASPRRGRQGAAPVPVPVPVPFAARFAQQQQLLASAATNPPLMPPPQQAPSDPTNIQHPPTGTLMQALTSSSNHPGVPVYPPLPVPGVGPASTQVLHPPASSLPPTSAPLPSTCQSNTNTNTREENISIVEGKQAAISMYYRALTGHATFYQYFEKLCRGGLGITNERNYHEMKLLAEVITWMVHELGEGVLHCVCAEKLLRRFAGLQLADMSGDYTYADVMGGNNYVTLLDQDDLNAVYKQRNLVTKIKKPASTASSGSSSSKSGKKGGERRSNYPSRNNNNPYYPQDGRGYNPYTVSGGYGYGMGGMPVGAPAPAGNALLPTPQGAVFPSSYANQLKTGSAPQYNAGKGNSSQRK
jgi:hypothetical protein